MNEIKYFSMFSGVGGFEVGLERANALSISSWNESRRDEEDSRSHKPELLGAQQFTCVGQSEFNKYSNQVLRYRFPLLNWGDCTKIRPEDLPDFDMLCGGFPCQSFSVAGKRKGFKDVRGTMFFEVTRIARIKRPKLILLENVKGLLNHEEGKTFRIIIQTLEELGYEFQWMVLNSKFHGVPQNRERVFIIGNLTGTSRPKILPFGFSFKEPIAKMQYEKLGKIYGNGDTAQAHRVYSPEGTVSSQRGCTQTRIRDGLKIRRLTPIECERLQGFPDDWTKYGINDKGEKVLIPEAQRYKQMGNAVTTNVIAVIGSQILKTKNNPQPKGESQEDNRARMLKSDEVLGHIEEGNNPTSVDTHNLNTKNNQEPRQKTQKDKGVGSSPDTHNLKTTETQDAKS